MLSGKLCKCSLMVCPVTWKTWPLGCSSWGQHWNASFSSNFKGAVSITTEKGCQWPPHSYPESSFRGSCTFTHVNMSTLEVTVRPFLFNFGDDQIGTGVALDWVCGGWREELESDAQYCENLRWWRWYQTRPRSLNHQMRPMRLTLC